jgi:hypothetical protein
LLFAAAARTLTEIIIYVVVWRLALAAILVAGADAQEKARPALPENARAVSDLAPAAPPEFAADVLLTLATTAGIEPAQRIELLDHAFTFAANARYPFRLVPAVPEAGHTDSDAGYISRALQHGLSALDLQVRAVGAMLTLDRTKARAMFESMRPLKLPALTCRDSTRPQVNEYYALLRELFLHGFSPKEKEDGKHLQFLEQQVRTIHSPFQLEPAARLLLTTGLPDEEFGRLVNAYAAVLKSLQVDDRSFTAGTTHGLTQPFFDLVKAQQKVSLPTLPLVEGYRSYLVRHLGSQRCADTAVAQNATTTLGNIIGLFNNSLLAMTRPATAEVPAIKPEELKPAGFIDERAKVYHFWATPASKQLLAEMRALRFGTPEQQEELRKLPRRADGMANYLSEEQRRDPAWEATVRDFLERVERWDPDRAEPPVMYFHQRGNMYLFLIEMIPQGALRDAVMSAFVSFVRQSSLQREDPPQWLVHLRAIMRPRDMSAKELAAARAELLRTGDPVMVMYVRLESMVPKGR